MNMSNNFRESQGLPKKITFRIDSKTLLTVYFGLNEANEYFSVASTRNGTRCFSPNDNQLIGVQAGLAKAFWLNYDKFRNVKLINFDEVILNQIKNDLEVMKDNYLYSLNEDIPKFNKKNEARDIGELVESIIPLTEIVYKLDLYDNLSSELLNNISSKNKMKV